MKNTKMLKVDVETHLKFKLEATKRGLTIKEYLALVSKQAEITNILANTIDCDVFTCIQEITKREDDIRNSFSHELVLVLKLLMMAQPIEKSEA